MATLGNFDFSYIIYAVFAEDNTFTIYRTGVGVPSIGLKNFDELIAIN